jgi:hypothetical protein
MGLDLELESVRRWFTRLRTMQDCALNISHDTPEDLTDFYRAKHSEIFTQTPQRDNFAFCVFRNTNISITNQDFNGTSTFAELLNESHRRLRTAVRGLYRAVAIEIGTISEGQDPLEFEALLTSVVYPGSSNSGLLCGALASVMPIFPQTAAAQAPFSALLAKPQTKVGDALKKVLEV